MLGLKGNGVQHLLLMHASWCAMHCYEGVWTVMWATLIKAMRPTRFLRSDAISMASRRCKILHKAVGRGGKTSKADHKNGATAITKPAESVKPWSHDLYRVRVWKYILCESRRRNNILRGARRQTDILIRVGRQRDIRCSPRMQSNIYSWAGR